jgi:hypothetical protein
MPRLRVSGGQIQNAATGRLPGGVADDGGGSDPAPEYIAEATTPSEDAWAREQARYRAKERSED